VEVEEEEVLGAITVMVGLMGAEEEVLSVYSSISQQSQAPSLKYTITRFTLGQVD
jgi:hypothetical protein